MSWFGGSKDKRENSEEMVDSSKSYNFTQNLPPPPGTGAPQAKPGQASSQMQQMQQAQAQQARMPQQKMMPAHMDDNEKIVIQAQRGGRKKTTDQIERGEMSIFAEKMASLVGPSYVLAFGVGSVYGLTFTPDAKQRRTTRLLMNSYLNNVGKTASRFANNSAAAVFMYIVTGKLINFIFLEEFDDFGIGNTYKNSIYGGVAGALYKSTRGVRPMCLGAILGAGLGSSYAYIYKKNFFLY